MKRSCLACGCVLLRPKYVQVADYEYDTYHAVDYYRCLNCNLLFQYPMPTSAIIPSFYPPEYRSHFQFIAGRLYSILKRLEVLTLVNKIDKIILHNRNSHILEVGCGNGLLLLTLFKRGFKNLYGTDISDAAAKVLSNRGIAFKKANIEKEFPFREKFDLIILNHVIEHLLFPKKVLRNCQSYLSKGGKIVIVTPDSDCLASNIFGKYWDGINAPRHFYIFHSKSMEYVSKSLKFHSIKSYQISDPINWAISLQNVFQNIPFLKSRLQKGFAGYTVWLGILFIPLSFLTKLVRKSSGMLYILK